DLESDRLTRAAGDEIPEIADDITAGGRRTVNVAALSYCHHVAIRRDVAVLKVEGARYLNIAAEAYPPTVHGEIIEMGSAGERLCCGASKHDRAAGEKAAGAGIIDPITIAGDSESAIVKNRTGPDRQGAVHGHIMTERHAGRIVHR